MSLTQENLTRFIEKHIPDFHRKRLESLGGLKLERVLARKNPYLFKAKYVETAGALVKQLLDAYFAAVNGCCYGRDNKPDKGDYLKLCGESFWALVSGNPAMYQQIVEPLGSRARERNEAFDREYAKVINRFTAQFIAGFCTADGAIDWEKVVAFNSATRKPVAGKCG